jgi:hypothetical protein
MKLPPIPGTVNKVNNVQEKKNGYTQVIIIHQEEKKNEQGYRLRKEQFFVVHIWSNKKDDSRFLKPDFEGAQCNASVYLDGQRWQGRNGFEYNHRLNLDQWLKEEEPATTQKQTTTSK